MSTNPFQTLLVAKNLVKNFGEAEFALTGQEPSLQDGSSTTKQVIMTTTTAIYTFDFTDAQKPMVHVIPNPNFVGALITLSQKPIYEAISPN